MKKTVIMTSLLIVAAFFAGGCSKSVKPPENAGQQETSVNQGAESGRESYQSEAAPKASQSEKVVIRFENHGANKHELFAEAVQIFNEAQDEVFVDFQTNSQDWEASFWAALAVNDAPDIITHIANSKIPQYVDAGHLMDLANMNCAAFIKEEEKPAVSYNGGLYAIPVQKEIYGVFYRKDLFAQVGINEVPKTISELETVVEKLKGLESDGIYPFSTQYRNTGQLEFYMTYGGSASLYRSVAEQNLAAEDVRTGQYNFDNERVLDIFRVYNIIRNNCQPKPEDTEYSTHNTYFAAGESAMLVMGNWAIAQFRELNPDLDIGMFALPVSENPADAVFAEDYNLVLNVNAHTEKAEAVDKFLTFFCDYQKPTKEFFIKNALPSGLLNFDQIVNYDLSLEAPLLTKETSEFFTRVMPNGFDAGISIQEFMLDPQMTAAEGVALLQNNYAVYVENMKE